MWQGLLLTDRVKLLTEFFFPDTIKKDCCCYLVPSSQCACMSQHTLVKPLCQTQSRQGGDSHPQGGSVIIPKHCVLVSQLRTLLGAQRFECLEIAAVCCSFESVLVLSRVARVLFLKTRWSLFKKRRKLRVSLNS